jgi:predicted RND superfamily exporter protein
VILPQIILRYLNKEIIYMIKYLQAFLGKAGEFELKHCFIVLILLLLFTAFSVVGLTKVNVESDFNKFNPKGIPSVDLTEKVDKDFSQFSSILIIVQLDDENDIGEQINDIRDPKIMEFLVRLKQNLESDQKIESVFSAGNIFERGVPEDIGEIKAILAQVPETNELFNDANTLTPVFVKVDVGGDTDKIDEMNNKIQEILESSGKPAGVKAVVTGEPPLVSAIFRLILSDGLFTLILAGVSIFLLLLIIQKSFKSALVVMVPVLLGIVWTAGTLGWLGIPITIATAAMGAMLLGLGTEYSIFLNSRYVEEKKKMKMEEALVKSLRTTGASTTSSGITTMIGFFALTLSIFPMLADMGTTFGLGIFFVLSGTMFAGPIVMILEEKYEKFIHRKEKKNQKNQKIKSKKESTATKAFEFYGKIVSSRPVLIIILSIVVTGFLFMGISRINNEEIDFDTVLPEDLPELVAFNILEDEIQDTASMVIFVEINPGVTNSNEPQDIRDPRVINYIDKLSQKTRHVSYVVGVTSISTLEKQSNDNIIPSTLTGQKQLLENLPYQNYLTKDFSGSIIRIELDMAGFDHQDEIVRQIYELIETTEKPVGIKVNAAGGIVMNHELNKIINPDSGKTAIYAFGFIILFLFLLSRSFKYTILPLITVVVAIIWLLGLIGYLQIGFNSIISSVISMTIGIGIDFGIQLSMRFRQELVTKDKKEAMKDTLKYTLYPMGITVIAALIGFQAMSLGQLKMMQNLGNVLSVGILASMLVAVTLVAGLMLVFEKDRKNKLKIQNINA